MERSAIIQQIFQHQTVRQFTGEKISPQVAQELVAAGQRAASSQNMQSFSVISVTDEKILAAIAEITGYDFILKSGWFFVFLADQYRNQQIIAQLGGTSQKTFDRFLAGVYDATLASENVTLAAESLGYGTAYLGSILNDAPQMIELLHLPPLTMPIFGLAVGQPAVSLATQVKPRVPQELLHFTNEYPSVLPFATSLAAYDEEVFAYYQEKGYPKTETFSKHLLKAGTNSKEKRKKLLSVLRSQGFLADEQ